MPDLNSLSNEELMAIAGVSPPSISAPASSDLSSMSNEDLMKIAGVSEPETIQQKAAGVLGSVGQGVTFGLADEAAAGVRAGISGAQRFLGFQPSYQDYESELEALRGGQKQFAENHPVVDTVGEIAGSLAIPVGGLLKGATLTQKLGNAAKLAAGMGAAYGFGKGEGGVEERGLGAAKGFGTGLVLGPAFVGGVEAIKGTVKVPGMIGDIFSQTAKAEKAKDAAQKIVSEGVDVPTITKALESFNKAKSTEFSPYMRTAEVTADSKLASLEEALRRMTPEIEPTVQRMDATRESARRALYDRLIPEDLTPEVAGTRIREGLEANFERSKEAVSKLAEKAFKGGEELRTFPGKMVVSDALNEFTKSGARSVTGEFQKLVDNFRALPARVELQTLQDYRSAFGKFAGSGGITASPTEKMTAEIAGRMRSAVDNSIEKAVQNGELPKGQASAWRKMIEQRRTQGETYEGGIVGKLLEKEPFNAGYKIDNSKAATKALGTPEDARALIQALGPNIPGKEALRTSLLNEVWKRSTNTQGELIGNSFSKQLRLINGVDKEVLTPKQITVLEKIATDLRSQASVGQRAFRASRGQSITTQSLSALDQLQAALKEESLKTLSSVSPRLGRGLQALRSVVADPKAHQQRIARELADFALDPKHAEALLKRAPLKNQASLLDKFAVALESKVPNVVGSQSPTEGSSDGPKPSLNNVGPKQLLGFPQSVPSSKSTKTVREPQELSGGFRSLAEALAPAVIKVESGGKNDAVSPKGAAGLMQLMPRTAKNLGVSDRFDPEQNVEGGIKLLAEELARFKSVPLALAAYNAGSPMVMKAIEKAGTTDPIQVMKHLPKETQNYLPKVMKALESMA